MKLISEVRLSATPIPGIDLSHNQLQSALDEAKRECTAGLSPLLCRTNASFHNSAADAIGEGKMANTALFLLIGGVLGLRFKVLIPNSASLAH